MRLLPALVGALATSVGTLVACSGPTEPARTGLLGRWVMARESLVPSGSYEYQLTFGPDDRFAAETRLYGFYPGQRAGELAAYFRTVGAFRADGERLILAPDSLITWDRMSGVAPSRAVRAPYPDDGAGSDTRYAVRGGRLVLRYLTSPADAPDPITLEYRRRR